MKIEISVVIVSYKAEAELIDCISSILKSKPKKTFEIIVVDNNPESVLGEKIISNFPKVKYIRSGRNLGYGGGNNLGAQLAQGRFLFFLNPDTKIISGALDDLCNFLMKNNDAGMVSPVFFDSDLKAFKSQGSKELTPKTIIFSQSFLRKIFPWKNIFARPMLRGWDMKEPILTEVVPGAAMMISSELFNKVGKFDESLFLYFEENDLSGRVASLGRRLYIVPSAKIIHLVGRSTRGHKNIEGIYSRSRYLYLKKRFGPLKAILTQAILSINKTSVSILFISILALFLRLFNLGKTMPFIGDQGWFYLSARDMLLSGQIPLVGIASSHPWLHQGPLWTYMLAGVFRLLGFNPLNGAYLTVLLGVILVLLIYFIGSRMFSRRIGLISALLCATSPLIITYSRMPYHTSPIPLFTLLFIYSLYKFTEGNTAYFSLSIFFLAILYNFELATSILWFLLFVILLFGIWKKKVWTRKIFNARILLYSIIAFSIPMLPILIYDVGNNFPQTLKFIAWIGYRILKFFGFPSIHGEDQAISLISMGSFSFNFYQNLMFAASGIISFAILLLSSFVLFINSCKFIQKKGGDSGFVLLSLWTIISLVGYFVNGTSSEAYLPIIFPALIFLAAYSFDRIMKIKLLFIPTIFALAALCSSNAYFSVSNNYFNAGLTYEKRLAVVKELIASADKRPYNLSGLGAGSQFESFTMNYEYLAWWLGNAPSKTPQKLKFVIREDPSGASLIKNE